MQKEIEVNVVIDEGNCIIDNTLLPYQGRTDVHDKMKILHDNWEELCIKVDFRQQR